MTRATLVVVLVVGCGSGKSKAPAGRDAAPAVVRADAAPPISVELHSGGSATLGDLSLSLEAGSHGSGPGVSMSIDTLHIRRGDEDMEVGLVAGYDAKTGRRDRDAEVVAYDRLLLIDDDSRGLIVTWIKGPPPAPLDESEASDLVDAEAARTGREPDAPGANDGFSFGPPGNDGVVIVTAHNARGRAVWVGQIGLYSRRIQIRDVPPPDVYPAPLPGSKPLRFDTAVKLPGGIVARLEDSPQGATLTLAKGGKQVETFVQRSPHDAEIVAFGRVVVVYTDGDGRRSIAVAPGAVPAELARDEALAKIEAAATAGDWPLAGLDAVKGQHGLQGQYPGIFELSVDDRHTPWRARVGAYTRRVWITAR